MRLIALILLALLVSGCASLNCQRTSEKVWSIEEVVGEVGIGNYEGLSTWLKENFNYCKDKKEADEWRNVSEALLDGFGDCEEYAQISLACLRLMGLEDIYLMGVTPKRRNYGHVVTIFRETKDSDWLYFDFEKLRKGPRSFKKLPRHIGRYSRYGRSVKYRLADKDLKAIQPEDEHLYGLYN